MIASVLRRPIVPLLFINHTTNQERARELLDKLRKVDWGRAKAIGMVVETDNYMPVQLHKLNHYLKQISQKHNIKIYGFGLRRVSPGIRTAMQRAIICYRGPIKSTPCPGQCSS